MWTYMKARFLLDLGFVVNYWWVYIAILLVVIGVAGYSMYLERKG